MASRGTITLAAVFVLALSVLMLWQSASRDALFPPDEGRYSAASVAMVEGGSWLIPVFEGEPHLTKPPLTYWAQATSLRLLGHTELAVRLPSLIASSLTLLLLFWFGSTIGGIRVGMLSAATLAVMPLFIIVGRLAITDPMLNLFWFAALVFGFLAIQSGAWKWAGLTWLAVALGLMTKGPLALMPIALLALWAALGGRWSCWSRLRTSIGLPLALVPLGIWVWLVARQYPDPFSIWYRQIIARAVGTGDHREPIWYYLPIFLVGLLPGTAMLVIPGLNLPWRMAWAKVRAGEPGSLWAMAVIVPLIMFSLMSGKLPHYLLPLCAPMALLTAITVENWLTGKADAPEPGTRPPEVVAMLTFSTALVALAGFAVGYWLDWRQMWKAIPLALPLIACAWMWGIWRRRPHLRSAGVAASWLAACIAWMWAFKLGHDIRGPHTASSLVARVRDLTGLERPRILLFGFRDATIQFYSRRPVTTAASARDAQRASGDANASSDDLVLLVDANDWDDFIRECPKCSQAYERIGESTVWFKRQIWVLRPVRSAGVERTTSVPR